MSESKRYAIAVTSLASFLWGTSFIVNKVGSSFVDAFNFTFLRFLVAALIIVVVAIPTQKLQPRLFKDPKIWLLGATNAGGFIFQYLGITLTSASVASLLVNTSAIFVPVFSGIFLKELFPRTKKIAVALAIIGIVLLTTGGDLSIVFGGSLIGDIFVLLAGITWAVFMISNKHLISKDLDVLAVTVCIMVTTALITMPFAFLLGTTNLVLMAWQGWASVFYTGIFCSLGAFYLWSKGLRSLSATASSLILLLEIVWAVFLGFMLLGESFGVIAELGAVLLMVAIFLASR